jgi:cobalt-zinc-cadmium resistance protein CzcA
MVRRLVEWALDSPLIVLLLAATLVAVGLYSFKHINVEAYPDPAPAAIEIIAQWPGASAEEMERLVTTPLEISLAGMPGLKATHSKSLFGLSHLRNVFNYGVPYEQARQEVINRLTMINQPLPPGVRPQISPASPIGEIYRYTMKGPKDALGNDIYTLNDLKALQDWLVEREFRRVPRIIDVTSFGGTVKRYEIQPDPDRMKRYGVTLSQLSTALTNSNANVGGDYLIQGQTVKVIRCLGVIGGGKDPMEKAFGVATPQEAAAYLREQDRLRCNQIRDIVITSNNFKPVRIDDIVDGGPLEYKDAPSNRGVIVSHQTRLGRVSQDRFMGYLLTDAAMAALRAEGVPETVLLELGPLRNKEFKSETLFAGEVSNALHGEERDRWQSLILEKASNWRHVDEKVQCVVLMRKGEQSLPSLEGVKAKVEELNQPGRLLPGVVLEPYYDREELVHLTTHTVVHNLLLGIGLVTLILLMFLSNVRTAIIVAINIPLALLFAFSVLFLRGKSANLLSIGAVDFGIIVDSAVIMVENIFRHIASGEHATLPFKQRILLSVREIDRPLFFSTAIMVCAFIPLFTMHGAEGELFGPMAQTYAFALGGALLLALTLTPVLCMLLFRNMKPVGENILVRTVKYAYLWLLRICLAHRWATIGVMVALMLITAAWPMRLLGREFMPELEEGNLWIRAVFPVHISLDGAKEAIKTARQVMSSGRYPEVAAIVVQVGRPDDGTDPGSYNNVELFVPLKPQSDWPVITRPNGKKQRRTRHEIVTDMSGELQARVPGVDWAFSQYIRDNVMECISGVKGDNSIKIYGPDLNKLEELAERIKNLLAGINGLFDLGIYHVMGQSNFEFVVDKEKCKRWGVQVADVDNVINTAVHGAPLTQMIEGEKTFDVTLRWPFVKRQDEISILEIPVDISNVNMAQQLAPGTQQTPWTGGATGPATGGTQVPNPAPGSVNIASYDATLPRLRLKDLVSPVDEMGQPDPSGNFTRPGGSIITREQGKRFIAVRFSVREGLDLASAVTEVKDEIKKAKLIEPPYRVQFGGEFEQMEDAEGRLMFYIPASLTLIFLLLYVAFRSLLDALAVLCNVLAIAIGGIWSLYLTGTNFSIAAAVGFVSLFGVGIMDGLLLISYFNALRSKGHSVNDAIIEGSAKRLRPMLMTDLTAILGLLPAALSTAIGAQTQRPLAIVVVGGMITILVLTRYLMPVLYTFYGHREPPADASQLAH